MFVSLKPSALSVPELAAVCPGGAGCTCRGEPLWQPGIWTDFVSDNGVV